MLPNSKEYSYLIVLKTAQFLIISLDGCLIIGLFFLTLPQTKNHHFYLSIIILSSFFIIFLTFFPELLLFFAMLHRKAFTPIPR
jgi:hypothetical protein